MFANVFFEIANVCEFEQYVAQVNQHLTKTDRRLVFNPEYTGIQGCVAFDVLQMEEDEGVEQDPIMYVVRVVDGVEHVSDVYLVALPTVERPVLELTYYGEHATAHHVAPVHTDAAPFHVAQCVDQLDF